MLTLINGPFEGGLIVPPDPATPRSGRVVFSSLQGVEAEIPPSTVSVKAVLSGEEFYEIDGRSHRLTPGQLLLVDKNVSAVAGVRRANPTIGLCLYLPQDPSADEFSPGFENLGARAVLAPSGLTPLGEIMRGVARQLSSGVCPADTAGLVKIAQREVDGVLRGFGRGVSRLAGARLSTRRDMLMRLERARALLHATREAPLSLDEMARHVGMSPFHFARSFAQAFDKAPVAYHTEIRLNHAAEEIRTGRMTPSQASDRLGFSEMRAFRRAFERVIGTSPSHVSNLPDGTEAVARAGQA